MARRSRLTLEERNRRDRLRSRAREIGSSLAGTASRGARAARERGAEAVDRARESTEELRRRLRERQAIERERETQPDSDTVRGTFERAERAAEINAPVDATLEPLGNHRAVEAMARADMGEAERLARGAGMGGGLAGLNPGVSADAGLGIDVVGGGREPEAGDDRGEVFDLGLADPNGDGGDSDAPDDSGMFDHPVFRFGGDG